MANTYDLPRIADASSDDGEPGFFLPRDNAKP